VVAGDEETFRFMYRLKQRKPVEYKWLMVYPGDWHLLLHSAKALLERYWGAGIEHVAKEMSGDDKKAAEGSNYRRAHHHLTVMYEAFMTEVIEDYYCKHPGHARQAADIGRRIPDWIKAQAEEHNTFKLWAQFILEDYPAYIALRTALQTGNFKLRLAALCRIAPVFCGYGKNRYQWLVSVHLADMARMTDDDYESLSYLFSTSLGGDAFARVGLDEKQEVANRLYKGAVMKITRAYVRKMAAIVEARELAMSTVQEEYFETGKSRDPVAELVWKRREAVLAARPALRGESAFQAIGKSTLMALDGREATIAEATDILGVPELCKDKFVDVVKSCALPDKSANGPTKKRMGFFPAARNSNTATKKERGSNTAQKSLRNQGEVAKELHKALRTLVEDCGSATKEQVEQSVLGIGAVLPQALANVEGGEHVLAVIL
ncbi:unnamed protein product, partial [Ascophyllum nodosum]